MQKSIGPRGPRQPQPAHDLRLFSTPDGLEVGRIFRRPRRNPNFIATEEESSEAVLLTAEMVNDLGRGNNPVTRQDIESASKGARDVVLKKRGRQQ